LEYSSLEHYDSGGMHKIYDKWPTLARTAFESSLEHFDIGKVDHIVFAGMGGSGLLGNFFQSALSKTGKHIDVIKGYVLPPGTTKNSLIIPISVSGNSQETLSILKQANQMDANIISFSSGGKIEQYCNLNNLNHVKILFEHSPRATFPILLYTMLNVLEPIFSFDKKDIYNSLNELNLLSEKISSNNLTNSNPSLNLAKWLTFNPIIYYPEGLHAAAIRFKASLQENAKTHVFLEEILETCHNGIVAWESTSNIQPVLIRGPDDHPKTNQRWEILKEFLNSKKISYWEVESISGGIISKLIYLIYMLDYTSIYRAIMTKVDPSPILPIDFIKNKLTD
jgi:glucose/mannose-6-phosphate isomerase